MKVEEKTLLSPSRLLVRLVLQTPQTLPQGVQVYPKAQGLVGDVVVRSCRQTPARPLLKPDAKNRGARVLTPQSVPILLGLPVTVTHSGGAVVRMHGHSFLAHSLPRFFDYPL